MWGGSHYIFLFEISGQSRLDLLRTSVLQLGFLTYNHGVGFVNMVSVRDCSHYSSVFVYPL